MRTVHHGLGDGDPCPVAIPGEQPHGKMLVIPGTGTQYCPNQSHDGVWTKDGHTRPTRSRWPVQWFSKAVDEHRRLRGTQGEALLPDIILDLPDLDLDMEFDL